MLLASQLGRKLGVRAAAFPRPAVATYYRAAQGRWLSVRAAAAVATATAVDVSRPEKTGAKRCRRSGYTARELERRFCTG